MTLVNGHGTVHLSINSSYFCNFSCKNCYLTNEQLRDKKLMPLDMLDRRIQEIKDSGYYPGHADIYGGEVLLYPKGYVQEMKAILHSHGINEIEIITNLSTYNADILEDPDFGISVSYDFEYRQSASTVFGNMLKLQRPFTVLTLATPEIIEKGADAMLQELSLVSKLMAWEIKPYSPNQANAVSVPHDQFEKLVIDVLTSSVPRHYEFLNEGVLDQAIHMERNSFSDDHVYITPSGNFGVLEFDLNDNEYFLELDTFQKYLDWTIIEKNRVYENSICSSCEYMGKCISEHLRNVRDLTHSCNGYYKLIKWAEENLK